MMIHPPILPKSASVLTSWKLLLVWVMLISACAAPRRPDTTDTMAIKPAEMLQNASIEANGLPEVEVPTPSPLKEQLSEDKRLFTLTFQNAPLSDVLEALSRETQVNVLVESNVDLTRPITVHLKNVLFADALDLVVVHGAGYAWRLDNASLHISRFKEHIYHFDYLNVPMDTDIQIGGDMLASSVEGSGVSGQYLLTSKKKAEENSVWLGIETALNGMKSSEGQMWLDHNVGVIYMSDTPSRIDAMIRYLDAMSESLHREVYMEAKILEVNLNENNQYGINWSSLEVDFLSELTQLPDSLTVAFNGGSSAVLSGNSRVNALVNFLQTQGDVSLISNPHLSVMNGQTAVMTVGYQYPYSDIQGVERDPETGITTFVTSINRAVLGLQMGISAQISQDGIVTMHLVPTITRIQREQDVEIPTTASRTQTISNPIIDLQEMATSVRVREGQSVVIGGLISTEQQLEHSGVPWLHRIPVVGMLFGERSEIRQTRELVMVITPHLKSVQ